MKSNQLIAPVIAEDFMSIRFDIKGLDSLTLDMSKLSAAVRTRASAVGMAQVRIVDAAAVSRTDKSGKLRSEAEMLTLKRENMAALIAHYETGTEEWSRVRATAGATGGYLFEALCRMYADKTPEEIRTFLEGLTDKEQNALRDDDEVVPHIRAIKAERNAGKPAVDTKGLLGKIAG